MLGLARTVQKIWRHFHTCDLFTVRPYTFWTYFSCKKQKLLRQLIQTSYGNGWYKKDTVKADWECKQQISWVCRLLRIPHRQGDSPVSKIHTAHMWGPEIYSHITPGYSDACLLDSSGDTAAGRSLWFSGQLPWPTESIPAQWETLIKGVRTGVNTCTRTHSTLLNNPRQGLSEQIRYKRFVLVGGWR